MKVKPLIIGTALAALALTSCGTKGHYGTYQFQMGKANESHIGIYMDLTSEKTTIDIGEIKRPMEKFSLTLELPDMAAESETSLVGGLLTFFKDGLKGGYEIDKNRVDDKGRNHLTLVPDLTEFINSVTEAAEEAEEGGDEPAPNQLADTSSSNPSQETSSSQPDPSSGTSQSFVIPSEFVDELMISTFSNDTINITIPVSLTDLMLQLYWYGFDLLDIEGTKELVKHEHGSHPTAEDVKEINKTFNSETSLISHFDLDAFFKYKTFKKVEFRDFNQLTMTLKRSEL